MAAALAEPQPAARATAQEGEDKPNIIGLILRFIAFYYFMNLLLNSNRGDSRAADPSMHTGVGVVTTDPADGRAPRAAQQYTPLLHKAELVDLWVFVSEEPTSVDFKTEKPVWFEEAIELGKYETPERTLDVVYTPSEAVQHNGSVYAHVFFARSGNSPDKNDPDYRAGSSWGVVGHPLITYGLRPKVEVKKKLFGNTGEEPATVAEGVETVGHGELVDASAMEDIISFWKPNLTINLVDDYTRYDGRGIPPQIRKHLILDDQQEAYYPFTFMNDFWLLHDKLVQVNHTVPALNLTITVGPISLMKWQMLLQMEESFKTQMAMGTMKSKKESDELKRVLLEGNPLLLGVTMCVSLLHSVFDMLAFKNDVSFWKKNKSMEGLSMRSIVVNAFSQLVICLYLFDNETSWVVLISSVIGTCIEFWKVTKAANVSIDNSGAFPKLRFTNRESYTKSRTAEYDEQAMKYMSWVLYPCIACYAVYSMYYNEHKGWYSFVLNTLVGCVYTFGFIMMCPQLYINYRLKSVAHMPWRQMTYKFLNTIIDDLFAFVIKMPTLHRLSVFRDDIIFLIYLYQRYKYRVDMKRVNEFGFGGEDAAGESAEKQKKEYLRSGEFAGEDDTDALIRPSELHEADIMEKVSQIANKSLEAARERKGKASGTKATAEGSKSGSKKSN